MAEKGFGAKEINLIGSSGTPTIESTGNLNLNANNVAISTNVSIGGTLTVSGNISVGGTLTYEDVTNIDAIGIVTARTGLKVLAGGANVVGVVTATSFTGSGANLTSLPAGNLTGTLPAISGANLTNLDASDLASGTIPDARFPSTLPAVSGANLTGIAVTEAPVTDFTITSNSSSAYRFNGGGVDETADDPNLYLIRGQKYRFNNTTGSSHPFKIRVSNGGSDYTNGLTGDDEGVQFFTVPYSAPASLVYQCEIHSGMVGNIYIRSGADIDSNGNLDLGGFLRFDNTVSKILTDTSDGSDDKLIMICGGGDTATSRGALAILYGNELNSGRLDLYAGVGGGAMTFSTGTTTTERLRITGIGSVGIGTDDPHSKFYVFDSSQLASVFRSNSHSRIVIQSGASSQSKLEFADTDLSDRAAIIYDHADESMRFQVGDFPNNDEKLRIDANGKVGIGTNNPNWQLTVQGSSGTTVSAVKNTGGNATLYAEASNGNTAKLELFQAGVSGFSLRTGSTDALQFFRDSTFLAQFDNSGRLLVGHSASVSSGKIQAYASNQDGVDILSYSTTNTHGGRLTFYRSKNATVGSNTEVAEGDSLGRIDWRGYNDDGTTFNQGARIEALVDGAVNSTTDMPTALVFKTSEDGSSTPEERLRITSDGKVGIASDIPVGRLDVFGTSRILATFGASGGSSFERLSIRNDVAGYPAIGQESSVDTLDLRSFGNVQATIDANNNSTGKYFRVMTNGAGNSGTELFRVQDDGNVGIGFNNPSQRLVVHAGSDNSDVAVFTGGDVSRGLKISTTANTLNDQNIEYDAQGQYGQHIFKTGGTIVARFEHDNPGIVAENFQTGDGDNSPAVALQHDHNAWGIIFKNDWIGNGTGWGTFWAGSSGARYRRETNDTNPNEYVFVGSGNKRFTFELNNGTYYSDGSVNGSYYDYAEYFEWEDGNPSNEDRRGYSVFVNSNGKIEKATDSTNTSDVIGAITGTAHIIGDGAVYDWQGKWKVDEWGTVITEDVKQVTWKDEDGKSHSYDEDKIPSGLTVPSDASYRQYPRRILNPDYDETKVYVPRDKRQEWDPVGLLGKVRVRDDSPKNPNWKLIKTINGKKLWLIR